MSTFQSWKNLELGHNYCFALQMRFKTCAMKNTKKGIVLYRDKIQSLDLNAAVVLAKVILLYDIDVVNNVRNRKHWEK